MSSYEFPPRKILVPVDFSVLSIAAWRQALRLARRFRCGVEAVYVYPVFIGPGAAAPAPLSALERRQLRRAMLRTYPGAAAAIVEQGDILLGILRSISRRRADLVVMATGGRTGLKRLMLPAMTENVVRSSPVPVLSVHKGVFPGRDVLAPVNLEPYSLAGLRLAGEAARALGVGLTVLFVNAGKARSLLPARRLEAAVAELRVPARTAARVVRGKPLDRILEQSKGCGLIVMTVHRKGVIRDAVLGGTAEQVLRRSRVPVLSVPPRAR